VASPVEESAVATGTARYFACTKGKVNYLTHVSRRHRAVFVEVPKAGCTVVKRVMQHSEHGGEPYEPPVSVHDRATSPLGAPLRDGFDLDELFGPDGPFFRFTFVRNPYSRALSCYLEKIAGAQWLRDKRLPLLGFRPDENVGFGDFLEAVADQDPVQMDIHWAPQSLLLGLPRVRYGVVGRFESFEQDLRTVIDLVGLDAPEPLWRQRSSHSTGARERLLEHYDDRCEDLVRRIYLEDFERLGYGFDLRGA
jgi:hypothetical protein